MTCEPQLSQAVHTVPLTDLFTSLVVHVPGSIDLGFVVHADILPPSGSEYVTATIEQMRQIVKIEEMFAIERS